MNDNSCDFRANEIKPIHPSRCRSAGRHPQKDSGTSQPFQVVSGYRSPITNAMLHANSEGVAVHRPASRRQGHRHLRGEGRSLAQIRRAAWSLQGGGVGYYPRTGFVHVDTGGIRFLVKSCSCLPRSPGPGADPGEGPIAARYSGSATQDSAPLHLR